MIFHRPWHGCCNRRNYNYWRQCPRLSRRNPRRDRKRPWQRHPTIGNFVTIGAGAKVLGNITIEDNSNIGAGSVVIDDVPEHSTVVGIPGRIVQQRFFIQGQLLHNKIPDPVTCQLNRLTYELKELKEKMDNK